MTQKILESEKLLLEHRLNKENLEERLIEKRRLKNELELKLNERNKDKENLTKKIKDKNKELVSKKEKIYKVIKFIKVLIEKRKIQEEIDKLVKIKEGVEENVFQAKENIKTKEKEIFSLKENIELKQKEILFILSQRKKNLELFENRWVKKIDIPKLKEARLGISNNFSNLSPYEFEHFVATLLREMGYKTKVTQKTGDYGIDIVAKKENKIFAVQCKRYQEKNLVGNGDIQKILGAMVSIKANSSIFVTTSKFTRQAIKQAEGCSIELWDKTILHELVKKHLLDLEIKEIFSLMDRERKEKLEREQERMRLLEEKRENARLKKEERRERLEERNEREREKRICPRCGGGKMKTRQYCSVCKREIRMENRYDDYW